MRKEIIQSVLLLEALLLLGLNTPASGQSSARGVLTPPNYDTFQPPPVHNSYVDPVFGSTVKRISNALATPNAAQGGFLTWISDEYSTMSPFNSDNSRILLVHQSYFGLYDGTGLYIRDLPLEINASSEPRWSRRDNQTLYYVHNNQLKSYGISSGVSLIVRTFSEYSAISGMGQSDISFDGDHFVFAGDRRYVFVYQISTGTKSPVFDTGVSGFDSICITPRNNVIISWLQSGTGRNTGQELFDRNMNFLRQVGHADGHSDVTLDSDGDEVLVWTNSADPQPICNNGIVKIRLADGTQTCLATLDFSLAVHVSAPDNAGFVYVETYAPSNPSPSTSGWVEYTNELLQIKLDGSQVLRLAHHRSRPYQANTYNWQPKISTSRDGTRVVYTSDYDLQIIDGYSTQYGDTYLIVVGGPSGSTPPPVNGLIGYWNFDEGSGNIAHDISPSGYNAALTGALWTAGKINSGLSFNGGTNFAVTPAIALGNAFSISTWVNSAGSQTIYARIAETQYYGGFYLGVDASGSRFKFIVNTGVGSSGACGASFGCAEGGAVSSGWHLITGTFDGSIARLYVDNALVASDTFIPPASTDFPLYIGRYFGSSGYGWNGALDEVRLYNRALTIAEISSIYTFTGSSDATPPTVSITAPTGGTLSGAVTLSANASDNVGVSNVQFQLDGSNLGPILTTAPYLISWDTTEATNGPHILTAIAKDAAPNSTTSAPVTVTVNNFIGVPSLPGDLGVFRNGQWWLDANGDFSWTGAPDRLFYFGQTGDVPIMGDWDNTGMIRPGVFRNGQWWLDMNNDGLWDAIHDVVFNFGQTGDVPLIGDWDGTGIQRIGVFRNGQWWLDLNNDHQWDVAHDSVFYFGQQGDVPLVGDWDNTGRQRIGVFRSGQWWLDMNADHLWDGSHDIVFYYGQAGDTPLVGDWTHSGQTRIGVFRQGQWWLDMNGDHLWDGAHDQITYFGIPSDRPLVAQ